MNPSQRVAELLLRCGSGESILPATELFNEGWMLRLVLDWASAHPRSISALPFDEGSSWYSEALLGSRFKPRSRGDASGEGFTHADAVIGHFQLRPGGRGDIELLADARQLTVVEAKLASGLSPGIKHAPDYNQAARNVACIAHLLESQPDCGASITNCGFVVLAPSARIQEGAFRLVNSEDIGRAVRKRAEAFDAATLEWCDRAFAAVLARCRIVVVSWEAVLDQIEAVDPPSAVGLRRFYADCLRWNPLLPAKRAV
ncbi:MAG: hypothetical protein LAO31_17995 [Acidobacteriia bacterium]|nr:hypothetical protein [Terriglobia bacterium]